MQARSSGHTVVCPTSKTDLIYCYFCVQRLVDERNGRVAELEDRLSEVQMECAALGQELRTMEAEAKREKELRRDRGAEPDSLQMAAWREETERVRSLHRLAEDKVALMEVRKWSMHLATISFSRS